MDHCRCAIFSEEGDFWAKYGYGDMLSPPLGNIERLANDIRIMRESGVTGATFQHDVGAAPMSGFTELQAYVMARLFDDVALDWRKLTDEFIDFEYGAAASGVKKYLAKLEQLRKEAKTFFPFDRIRVEADEILADCYAKQHADKAEQFTKWLDEGLFLAEIQSAADAKPLPAALFGAVPKNRLFVTMPRSSAGGIRDDKTAAYGKAAVYDAAGKPETMGLPFVANFGTRLPRSDRVLGIGRGVDAENIAPQGEYRFYEMGTVELTRDCFVEIGNRSLRATLNSAYVVGEFNKAKIYASLKFQGPAFYPAETNAQNRVWCDRVVVVRE